MGRSAQNRFKKRHTQRERLGSEDEHKMEWEGTKKLGVGVENLGSYYKVQDHLSTKIQGQVCRSVACRWRHDVGD